MFLKFPTARLFVQNLISGDDLSAHDAIARSACEYGLINPSMVMDIKKLQSPGACQCMSTIEKVLHKYFEGKDQMFPAEIDHIFGLIEKDAKSIMHLKPEVEPSVYQTAQEGRCAKHAPILFDLLLQQIRCHS